MPVMEEKKRGSSDTSIDQRDHKKALVDSTTTEDDTSLGPLTQDDVVRFQKEAIFRQMMAYKRDYELAADQLNRLQHQDKALQRCFSVLDTWWDQLIDVLVPNESGNQDDIPPALVRVALECSEENTDNEPAAAFTSVLDTKKKLVLAKVGAFFNGKSADTKELEASLAELSSKYHRARSENESWRNQKDNALKQLETVTKQYREAAHRLDRFQSPSVTRLMNQQIANGGSKPSEAGHETNGDGNVNVNKETASSEEYKKLQESLETTKIALEESKSVISKQTQQQEEQEKLILEMKQQIRDLSERFRNPSESDLAGTALFQQMNLQRNDLRAQNAKLESLNEKLKKECSDLIAGREEFENSLKDKYSSKEKEYETQCNKADQDVARIRAARDDLLSELNIKKASENDKTKSFEQLKDLVKIREQRITALEEENKSLRDNNSTESEGLNIEGANIDELRQLVGKLQKQNKNLSAEIPGLEAAFAKAHSKATAKVFDTIEVEAKVNRLIAEKTKADEKYFAAMRSKDAVTHEYQKIKAQLAKSAEMVTLLKEAERNKSGKVSGLEKQMQEMKSKLQTIERELDNAKLKALEHERQMEAAYRQLDRQKQELTTKDSQTSQEISARRSLEIQVEKLKVQLETRRMTSGSGTSNEIQEQLDALRSIAICSVCSKNWKNTCIKVCGHVFCYECAEDRLKARLRKCPVCNQQYSYNDLLSIHL